MTSQQHGPLDGRTIIVTGGTGGIGEAVCRRIAQAGGHVVVADLDQQHVEQLAADLPRTSSSGRAHLGVRLNVCSEADARQMAELTCEQFGRIDGLVACAGILRGSGTSPRPLVDVTWDEWQQVINTNLTGVFLTNRAVLPTMIRQRSGIIVNISSVSGLQGRANDGPYCASKFGVIGLTQSVADEVKRYGVKAISIMPEAVATPMWNQNGPVPPPGDALPPDRVADLILFLLTQPEDTVILGAVIAPLGARRRRLPGTSTEGAPPAT
jgi:NAD(P)-dependent dehydrogenase (short-subunit alcohol dehydrogenase family)